MRSRPQDYGCNKCYKFGFDNYSLLSIRTQGKGLTVTERVREESWFLVAAIQDAADAASTFVVCCVCEQVQ